MPKIVIANNKVSYNFEIEGKYSIIKGDSGTGKTTLCDLVRSMGQASSGIVNQSTHNLMVLPDNYSLLDISKLSNYVIFIDESSSIFNDDYESWLHSVSAYFVFITRRHSMQNLPISVDSIYNMTGGKQHYLECLDLRFKSNEIKGADVILVEDSKSGYHFIRQILKYANSQQLIAIETAGGNAKIIKWLNKYIRYYRNVIIVYDAAAMGTIAVELKTFMELHKECSFFIIDWDSFESYLLSTPAIKHPVTLKDCGCFYESLEQYATKVLENLYGAYDKSKLSHCFKIDGCKDCKYNSGCVHSVYNYSKFIMGRVLLLYKYLSTLQYNMVDYNTFIKQVRLNNMSKAHSTEYKIVKVEDSFGRCVLQLNNNNIEHIGIFVLVWLLMYGHIFVKNPEKLKNWSGFKREDLYLE